MQVKYIATHWGYEKGDLNIFVEKILEAGYQGIEAYFPEHCAREYKTIFNRYGIPFIPQHHLPNPELPFEQYLKNYEADLFRLAGLEPALVNAHTGRDYLSFDENCQLIEKAFEVTAKTGVQIVHEIHRGRFSFHPLLMGAYLKKYPGLQLNADFSHWCVVTESLLEMQQENLLLAIYQSAYIHARVGSSQAAQVNNPSAPEWQGTLQLFLSWWQQIVTLNSERQNEVLYICPEAGPPPYLPLEPFSQKPLASQWNINVFMLNYLKEKLVV